MWGKRHWSGVFNLHNGTLWEKHCPCYAVYAMALKGVGYRNGSQTVHPENQNEPDTWQRSPGQQHHCIVVSTGATDAHTKALRYNAGTSVFECNFSWRHVPSVSVLSLPVVLSWSAASCLVPIFTLRASFLLEERKVTNSSLLYCEYKKLIALQDSFHYYKLYIIDKYGYTSKCRCINDV